MLLEKVSYQQPLSACVIFPWKSNTSYPLPKHCHCLFALFFFYGNGFQFPKLGRANEHFFLFFAQIRHPLKSFRTRQLYIATKVHWFVFFFPKRYTLYCIITNKIHLYYYKNPKNNIIKYTFISPLFFFLQT